MVVGVMLSGIVSGLTGFIGMLLAGHHFLMALLCYAPIGMIGALAFILFASLRTFLAPARNLQSQPLTQRA